MEAKEVKFRALSGPRQALNWLDSRHKIFDLTKRSFVSSADRLPRLQLTILQLKSVLLNTMIRPELV